MTAVVAGAAVVAFVGAGAGYAAVQIGSSGIINSSIRSVDIKNGTIKTKDLSDNTIAQLQGARGPAGPAGPEGPQAADAGYQGATWSIVHRNTIGGGDADLQAGPLDAPFGDGSLMLRTATNTDKATFGNEQDFVGDPVSGLSQLAFSVFTTGENAGRVTGGNNMPSLSFEIDPNLASTTSNYSTLVYIPAGTTPNAWTRIDIDADAGDRWALTGAAGTATGCSTNGSYCTFDEVKTALADGGDAASILTVQLTKGRDHVFSGAVDGLQINGELFDFEPNGVLVSAIP